MISIEGKEGIKATIVQDSVNFSGTRITTFELEYPRFIHGEFMTHRMFSRNAASSRAIPVEKMHEHIVKQPATPIVWQKNQPGMQSSVDLEGDALETAQREWRVSARMAVEQSQHLLAAGLHKQWANRVTEPFQMMKVVVTSTEWDNFFWLRNHTDAQPEIHELARVMLEAHIASCPMKLEPGEWHLPYVNRKRLLLGDSMVYTDSSDNYLSLEDAKIISASCCAQVSYRKSDDTLEKARNIYNRLIHSEPVHASPVEHQATPMQFTEAIFSDKFEPGVTHMDRNKNLWSGNFRGWIQHRQLIPNHSR